MMYQNKIMAKLTALENYARVCLELKLDEPNGQSPAFNKVVDAFMCDLTAGELCDHNGDGVYLDDCLGRLLTDCGATAPKNSELFAIVDYWCDWGCRHCKRCGEWYVTEDVNDDFDHCPDCDYRAACEDFKL